MPVRYCLILAICLSISCLSYGGTYANTDTSKPALQLAQVYDGGIALSQYWVSEKLDGVRGYWNGRQLLTRQGNPIHAPQWFVAQLPALPLDGELWIGRGQFDQLSGLVRRQSPANLPVSRRQARERQWRGVSYMLFDLPRHPGTFDERLQALERVVQAVGRPWVQVIPQRRIASEEELFTLLDRVVAAGGEGLMLHRGDSRYLQGRSDALLKLKPWLDAEARVIEHLPGKGKYAGKLGALVVETPEGVRFKLGTGFTDAQRAKPPAIGSLVTYKYTAKTHNGVPRFASFLRIYRP